VTIKNLVLESLGPETELLMPFLISEVVAAGQVLKHDGQELDRVYFPVEGLFSSRVVFASGHEIEGALLCNTNALGLLGALGYPSGWARFVALTDGRVWSMPVAKLAALRSDHHTVERVLTRFGFAQVGYTARVGICNAMHSSAQRIARWLAVATAVLKVADLPVSQEELANILGLQRSAVNPALQKLKADGILQGGRGYIRVSNSEGLRSRACECAADLVRIMRATPLIP